MRKLQYQGGEWIACLNGVATIHSTLHNALAYLLG